MVLVRFETEITVTEKALINGDWSRKFSCALFALSCSWQFVAFDFDTVKLLMDLFVSRPLGVFSSMSMREFMSPCLVRTQSGLEALISTG